MPAEDRAVIVAAIRYVDHVIVVENDSDKRAVFEAVQPDLYLRGPDYARKEFPEFNLMKPWGDGIVGRSPLVTSTTGILKRLGLMR